jgi:RNA polymerase sigma factor (sigma-70 family)
MADGQPGTVLRHICRLMVAERTRELTDAQLLQCFAAQREEDAFAALVQRHGRLVWRVCRNVLGNEHDAEDAFQATFLVLARNVGAIRKQVALASWLHGTAYRTALRAKRDAAVRRARERREMTMPAKSLPDDVLREAMSMLDEEIQRLSPKQRSVFVLCSLEGKSQAEAAAQLGWKDGTVSGTLARARRQLREALARRGLTLSAALAAVALGREAASAALPAGLARVTVKAALGFAAGNTTAAVTTAVSLAERVTRTMLLTRAVRATVLAVALCLMTGTGFVTTSVPAGDHAEAGQVDDARPARGEPPCFEDVTASSGITFTFDNGEEANHYAILESVGGGVALIDYDGDGLLDIFVIGGGYFTGPDKKTIKGRPCRLYKNLGKFKFKDVTEEAGLGKPLFFSHGAAVLDYDNDGWPDILITGYGRVVLYRNIPGPNGTRRFVDVTRAAGLLMEEHFWGTSAACADFDQDGWIDVYICQYVDWSWSNHPQCSGYGPKVPRDICPPKRFRSRPHKLFRNNGRGRFVDVSTQAGIRVNRQDENYGKGLGVLVADIDGDGKPDIFVANDTSGNFLYLNKSRPGEPSFLDIGLFAGVERNNLGIPQGSIGCDTGDPYGSGRPALWVTNYEGELHGLYRNDPVGAHGFIFDSAAAGIAAIGQRYVGCGTVFLDLDNDGWEDIVIANGHVIRHPQVAPLRQRPVLLRNKGNGRFIDISSGGGSYFQIGHRGRGVALGDLDNDGFPDLVISNIAEPVAILKNNGKTNHWLGVKLLGKGRRDMVGSRIALEVDGRTLTRFAKSGGSYLSSHDPRRLFGLGTATKVGKLTVEWSGGEPRVETWEDLAVDRYHELVQGRGKAAR